MKPDISQAPSQGANQLISQQNISQMGAFPYPPQLAPTFDSFNNEGFNYRYGQNQALEEHLKKLKEKFNDLKDEIQKMERNPELFKNHQLPLARVKKIMKSDEDVRMISAEAPVLFAKACEIFIIELTHRAWLHTEESKRRTLQRIDIANCIAHTDIFDFLLDIIPKDEYKQTQTRKPNENFANFPPNAITNSQNLMMKDFNLTNKGLNSQMGQGLSNSLISHNLFQNILPNNNNNNQNGQNNQSNFRNINQIPYTGLKEENKPNNQNKNGNNNR